MTARKGTWREPDGELVDNAIARDAWTAAARVALIEHAQNYGSYITHKEFAEQIQVAASIRTTQRMDSWIGDVLSRIAHQCAEQNEPLLTSFCVLADESVGTAYVKAVIDAYGNEPEDLDRHAAEERLKAHQHFGAQVPIDGGSPRLPTAVARRRAKLKADNPPPKPKCPSCYLTLPATGVCDFCA